MVSICKRLKERVVMPSKVLQAWLLFQYDLCVCLEVLSDLRYSPVVLLKSVAFCTVKEIQRLVTGLCQHIMYDRHRLFTSFFLHSFPPVCLAVEDRPAFLDPYVTLNRHSIIVLFWFGFPPGIHRSKELELVERVIASSNVIVPSFTDLFLMITMGPRRSISCDS